MEQHRRGVRQQQNQVEKENRKLEDPGFSERNVRLLRHQQFPLGANWQGGPERQRQRLRFLTVFGQKDLPGGHSDARGLSA